ANNLKCLGIVGYNNMDTYKTNGSIASIFKTENPHKYFKGKIITNIEMVVTAKGLTSKIDGFSYYGHRLDILLFDYDPAVLEKTSFFDEKEKEKSWLNDLNKFIEKCELAGIKMPATSDFIYDGLPVNFVSQWFRMFKNDEAYNALVEQKLGRPIISASDLIRNFTTDPSGILFFEQELMPGLPSVLKLAKHLNCKVAIAHPAHMNLRFDYVDYITSLIEYSNSSDEFMPIKYVEADYMLNCLEETEAVVSLAKKLNLKLVGGSDMQCIKEMFYIDPVTNLKTLYEPKPGFAIKKYLETNNGDILVSEDIIKDLRDVSDFDIYKKKFENKRKI
ncbi:MAG: hypothetical protein RR400_03945, partial [Clostridia bacterium]